MQTMVEQAKLYFNQHGKLHPDIVKTLNSRADQKKQHRKIRKSETLAESKRKKHLIRKQGNTQDVMIKRQRVQRSNQNVDHLELEMMKLHNEEQLQIHQHEINVMAQQQENHEQAQRHHLETLAYEHKLDTAKSIAVIHHRAQQLAKLPAQAQKQTSIIANILLNRKTPVFKREFPNCKQMEKMCPKCERNVVTVMHATLSVASSIPVSNITNNDVKLTCQNCPEPGTRSMTVTMSQRQAVVWIYHMGFCNTANCYACQQTQNPLFLHDMWEISHDEARSKLGDMQIENVSPAHSRCNRRMHTMKFRDFWIACGYTECEIERIQQELSNSRLTLATATRISKILRKPTSQLKRPDFMGESPRDIQHWANYFNVPITAIQ